MTARHAPARPPLFRLSLRMPWRKPAAVPAVAAAGTATPDVARFACCPHCEGRCGHPGNHPAACTDGCNAPVLGDRMLSDVRAAWDAADGYPYPPVPLYAVRHDGLIRVDKRNHVEVCPSPLVCWWPTHVTGSFPAVTDAGVTYSHGELNRKFDGKPPRTVYERIIDGLRKLDVSA